MEVVSSGSGSFKATARRYSLCAEDAEDAYQRSLEIMMTASTDAGAVGARAVAAHGDQHEALAVPPAARAHPGRRRVARPLAVVRRGRESEELASERERVRRSAEALAQLKQCEVQCLLLKAVGYSYDEISAKTGYSWTKVKHPVWLDPRASLARARPRSG
jgi:DNA-directed RNA polymerase specialized sigma24 family protein